MSDYYTTAKSVHKIKPDTDPVELEWSYDGEAIDSLRLQLQASESARERVAKLLAVVVHESHASWLTPDQCHRPECMAITAALTPQEGEG